MDLYYRQVLDNIALLNTVPGSLPHFALASGGTTQVTDSGGLDTLMLGWKGTGSAADILGRRDVVESWSLVPVAEPDRLRAIQRLYETAMEYQPRYGSVVSFEPLAESGQALERTALLNALVENGVPTGWFGIGNWFNVPPGALHGSFEGTYAWVHPGRMRDLSKFTLKVLEVATITPTSSKSVTIRREVDGKPVYETRTSPGATYEIPRMAPSPQFYPQGR